MRHIVRTNEKASGWWYLSNYQIWTRERKSAFIYATEEEARIEINKLIALELRKLEAIKQEHKEGSLTGIFLQGAHRKVFLAQAAETQEVSAEGSHPLQLTLRI